MKRIVSILILISILLMTLNCLTGCGKQEISRNKYIDKVFVVNAHHEDEYTQPIYTGESINFIYYDAINIAYINYDKCEYKIDGVKAYKYANSNMGKEVDAVIVKIQYDNGTTKTIIEDFIYK